jgi:uroporphyrin-III C-methyltransferase/precorrin-2 dehydrogenase/sirohydrochlorin ferrochelatase
MRHFPIFLDLAGKPVLVVGAGRIADAKAEQLARSGAVVRRVETFDMIGDAVLVVCADPPQGEAVATAARVAKVPVNVVDRPEFCDFLWPSIVDRDPVTIAICTSGTSPVLARHLRTRIELAVPAAFGRLAEWAGSLRARIARAIPDLSARRDFWERILRGPAADLAMAGDTQAADHELDRALLGTTNAEPPIEIVLLPDAPDLLTLRDLRLLQNADAILHPAGIDGRFLELARRDAIRIVTTGSGDPLARGNLGRCVVRLEPARESTASVAAG